MTIATALDDLPAPPCAKLLGWRVLDARPADGWIRIGFDARPEFCNPAGFIQGGFLAAMLDDTMGPAIFAHTGGALYSATIEMMCSIWPRRRSVPSSARARSYNWAKVSALWRHAF